MPRPLTLLTVSCLIAASLVAATSDQKTKKPRPGPTVLVASDMIQEEALFTPPTAKRPAYYLMPRIREKHLGDLIAGEPMPDPADVEKKVVEILASQHYIRVGKAGDPMPSLIIHVAYGSANPNVIDSYELDTDSDNTNIEIDFFNAREMATLVGQDKASYNKTSASDDLQLLDAAHEDRFYILVGALDAKAKFTKKQNLLVWSTRMSIPAVGSTLPDNVVAMLKSGAPQFGRDAARPVFIDDGDRMMTEVILGPTKMLGVEEEASKVK